MIQVIQARCEDLLFRLPFHLKILGKIISIAAQNTGVGGISSDDVSELGELLEIMGELFTSLNEIEDNTRYELIQRGIYA